jgi:hypothetical protein
MPLFRRRRPDPPEWADFFDPDGWHEFSELVRYETGRRGRPHDFALGLSNLAQICRTIFAPPDELVEILNGLE